MYNRASMKVEVRRCMAATRPRPMWMALLYVVIVGIGSSILESLSSAITGMSYLTQQFTNMLDMTNPDPQAIENAIRQIILAYSDRLAALAGTVVFSSILISLLTTLWSALMQIGFEGYCLDLVKGEHPTTKRLFSGFPLVGKVILTNLLVWVFVTLWSILACVIMGVFGGIGALLMNSAAFVGVILIIVGVVLACIMLIRVTFRYAMVNFVMLDTGMFGLEAITASKNIMKGNKGKYFVLHLSFIGWYILQGVIVSVPMTIAGIILGVGMAGGSFNPSVGAIGGFVMIAMALMLAASIGVLLLNVWLMPYVTGSKARFYLFFKQNQSEPDQISYPEA